MENARYKKPYFQPQNPTPNPINHHYYQIVPIINHNKTHSIHLDKSVNSHQYSQYMTPNPSPMKIQGTPPNTHQYSVHPLQNTPSLQIKQNPSNFLCKTAERKLGPSLENENHNLAKNFIEKNKELLIKERDYMQKIELLSKKINILLQDNKSLNSIVQELGKELNETKAALKMVYENGDCKNNNNNNNNYDNSFCQNKESNEEMELKIQNLSKENDKLIKMIEIQNREENSLKFLEEKIDYLLIENNKLNILLKKEREIFFDYKKKFNDFGNKDSLEYENKVLEYKMQELQKKLKVIFEDNDKLERILISHETEHQELESKYENEIQKSSRQITQINELLIKIKDLKEALKTKQKSEEENKSCNSFHKLKIELEDKIFILIDQNQKLNDCLAKILSEGLVNSNIPGDNTEKEQKEKKIKLLLTENAKLQKIIEHSSRYQEKGNEIIEENCKLRSLLEEKTSTEAQWKSKYVELEKKIKNLF